MGNVKPTKKDAVVWMERKSYADINFERKEYVLVVSVIHRGTKCDLPFCVNRYIIYGRHFDVDEMLEAYDKLIELDFISETEDECLKKVREFAIKFNK